MNNKNERKIKRGDIYLYDYGENEGSIQNGYRPVVVLQADNFNLKAPTIMVAAITTAIPHFTCHSLRHTFSTRMCEAGINVKVIQDTLGHQDISTTMNIYTDATKEMKKQEFESLDSYLKKAV